VRRSLRQIAGELYLLPLERAQLDALNKLVAEEEALYARLSGPAPRPDRREVQRLTGQLADRAYEVLSISHLVADREVARLSAYAEAVQLRLVLLIVFGTAVALAIALGLARYIARPVSELDAAIRRLGRGDFSGAISVPGPEDLQSLGERLDWLRRRLVELEAEKNRFLRHLSHELKTPLTALREGTELLNDQVAGPLAPPQRQVVGIMRDNGIKLQRLIEDLLDYQRAVHAVASLAPRRVSVESLVADATRPHELSMQASGQKLVLDLERIFVDADPEKLRSVIDNLVGNAVKFTPRGGTIRIVARVGPDGMVLDVIDSGPGVPVEERESIFDSFFRGSVRAGGRVAGSGLGLAIARELAEAHGGRIGVVAGAEGGHFRLTLPHAHRRASARALAVAA
jgi:two-component system sensor histidine kinase GlrK